MITATVYSESAFDRAVENLRGVSNEAKRAAIIYESRDWGNDADVQNGVQVGWDFNTSGGRDAFFLVHAPNYVADVFISPASSPPSGLTTNEDTFFTELTNSHFSLGVEGYDLINGAYDNNLKLGAVGGFSNTYGYVYGDVYGPHVESFTYVSKS
jgi:hypothetical protein